MQVELEDYEVATLIGYLGEILAEDANSVVQDLYDTLVAHMEREYPE